MMNDDCCRLMMIGAILLVMSSAGQAAEWQDVLTSDDIVGWEPKELATEDSWIVEEGVLRCTGKAESREGTVADWGRAWIGTKQSYTDFALEFEFKLSPGGNSGVFLRVPKEGHPTFDGMEVQILDDHAAEYRDIAPGQKCGALYKIADPTRSMVKAAGEWNRMRVTCQGDHVTVELNGETIVDANGRDHPEILQRSPRGPVGLQNHGTPIWFRHIRFADLAEP